MAYGLCDNYLAWLTDFLTDRTMCVKVNSDLSDPFCQTSGVPQGSVLGPICFILFINDLPDCVKHCVIKLYADDVKLFFRFNSTSRRNVLQEDLNAIAVWANSWQLTISILKTFVMHIGLRNPKQVYKINNVDIIAVQSIKDLGVYVSEDLLWHEHILVTTKKASRVANVILHSFKSRNLDLYMKAFDTYVLPILDYCSFVWNPTLCQDIDLIENVQKCFTRRVFWKCSMPRMSYPDRLVLLNRISLERRRFVSSLVMFYKIVNKYVLCNILDNFNRPTHAFNLRGHDLRRFVPFCKSSIRKKFFTFRLLPVWNALPSSLVKSNVTTGFKNRIDRLDLTLYADFRY